MPQSLLQPIKLPDGRQLPTRIFPGPMEGVTEGSFLTALTCRQWCKAWITPFLRISTGVPRRARLQDWIAPYVSTGLPVIVQIMGTSSERLAETALRLKMLGVYGVDLNCACPSPTVLSNGSGGFCLKRPSWIAETIQAMKASCGAFSISLKIRCGYSSPSELPDILSAVQACAPTMLTVHFRTVSEMYKPISAGLDRLQTVRESLPEQFIIGSGDLFTPEAIIRMRQITGVNAVAPARGLLTNPALLVETENLLSGKNPVPLTRRQRLEFLRDLADTRQAVPHAQNGFVLRMTKSLFGQDSDLFTSLTHLRSLRDSYSYLSQLAADTAETTDNQK